MSFYDWIFLAAAVVLFGVPPVLVWHRIYDDGLIGRMGLSGISFFAFVILTEKFFAKASYAASAEVAMMTLSCAVFLTWHLIRFLARVAREKDAEHPHPTRLTPTRH